MALHGHSQTAPRTLRRVDLDGVTLTEGTHPSGSALPWHDHDGPTLCFVIGGAFAEYVRGGVIDCRPSSFKVTPAGQRHWNRFHLGEVHGLLVEIGARFRLGCEPFEEVLSRPHHSDGGPESLLARRLLAELHAGDDAAELAMEGLLLELLAVVARSREPSATGAPPWLERARALIQDLPGQRHSLARVAAEVGVHPATLARGFRRHYGCTPGEMQRRVRLEFAAHQLASSGATLATVAQQAGFFDQSHFTNVFRRHFGTSPLRYRQALLRHN